MCVPYLSAGAFVSLDLEGYSRRATSTSYISMSYDTPVATVGLLNSHQMDIHT